MSVLLALLRLGLRLLVELLLLLRLLDLVLLWR